MIVLTTNIDLAQPRQNSNWTSKDERSLLPRLMARAEVELG
jgi:hypothetical protein